MCVEAPSENRVAIPPALLSRRSPSGSRSRVVVRVLTETEPSETGCVRLGLSSASLAGRAPLGHEVAPISEPSEASISMCTCTGGEISKVVPRAVITESDSPDRRVWFVCLGG